MRKHPILFPVLALGLTLGSCSLLPGGGGGEDPAEQPQAGGEGQPPAIPPALAPEAEAAAEEVAETSDILTPVASGSVFIPSTDADARRKVTAQGRTDPFADFPITPQVIFAPEPPPEPAPVQNVPAVSSLNGSGAAAARAAATTAAANANTAATTTSANNGANANAASVSGTANALSAGGLDFSPVLPTLPEATLAEETEVTGVIRLNGVDNIMVKAPNEEFSRYVQVGDMIANGQVKVKRVDFRRNSPVVVLEQYGIEIYKEVADALLADRSPKAETAGTSGS
ncbi:MAG: hypothetical protein HC799_05940 [Limnothrix sp. RL_2_0]|nr:hypothetical protein [Limnothrix sp. RL_2_0]